MGTEAVAVIGRNGMGKTTLCNSIMGIEPPSAKGSIRFRGTELLGKPSYKIAGTGIAYVPQGRRLFQSLTTDEHLKMIRTPRAGRWTSAAVYELFPRLAERKKVSATQLSGGEQQMLAIGRALLTNPDLLIMDEPSEGLAPTIVEQVIDDLQGARRRGHGDPARRAEPRRRDRGRRAAARDGRRPDRGRDDGATALKSDPDAQRRYLGVEPLAQTA